MIDYRAHALGLESVREALAAESPSDPDLDQARDRTLRDVAENEDSALLGAFVDHLMAHASSDGAELDLLRRAAELWNGGVAVYGAMGRVRSELEATLEAPAAGAADRFNEAAAEARALALRLHDLQADVIALRDEITPMPHLPPHPRQRDESSDSWDWGNFLLGRRTDAFVRALGAGAGDSATRAFAFGALSSYAANASGSPYLNHVVGGPRRAHRFRDRVARNSVGSWLRRAHASAPSLTDMARQLGGGDLAAPVLPAQIQTLIEGAVSSAFDPSRTPPLPDLGRGYTRLVEHLELLDRFEMPPEPAMPSPYFVQRLFSDPTNPPPTLRPQTTGVPGGSGSGLGFGPGAPGNPGLGASDGQSAEGKGCVSWLIGVILIALLLVVALVKCIVKWAEGKKCDYFGELEQTAREIAGALGEEGVEVPIETAAGSLISDAGLEAFSETEQAAHLVNHFWDLQQQLWEALDRAYGFLAKSGLIYPDRLIENPGYRQFTSIPEISLNQWPHRPEPDPQATYHRYPKTPPENPNALPSGFEIGASPDVFLALAPLAADFALPLWRQMALGEEDGTNFDLDADRGAGHPCWATGGSIDDDPVGAVVLAYGEQ